MENSAEITWPGRPICDLLTTTLAYSDLNQYTNMAESRTVPKS